ncbi:hypothetical protein DL96DRAFT_1819802 [Flagelloscypha sp. PMI_526]|nr:hypothetical protein DL96DRAFT_1819802 [Flagelloscypha sp. PMI_526]
MSSFKSDQLNSPEDFLRFSADFAIVVSVGILVGAVCYGVFLVISVLALCKLRQHPQPQTRPAKILRWTIAVLLLTVTLSLALQAISYMVRIKWPRYGSPSSPMKDRWNTGVALYRRFEKTMFLFVPLPYIAADAIPIWRACILWSHSRIAKRMLISALAFNTIIGIARGILVFVSMTFDDLAILRPILYPAQLGISTFTNALATSAIGIRAWHHRELTQNLRRSSASPVFVMVLLVEAGALLCFTQCLNLSINVTGIFYGKEFTNPWTIASVVMSLVGDTVAAAYPALIVVVLSLRGSMLGNTHNVASRSLDLGGNTNLPEMQQDTGRLTSIQFVSRRSNSLDAGESTSSPNLAQGSPTIGGSHPSQESWKGGEV